MEIKPRKCICCNKEINTPYPDNEGMWDDAVVGNISGNYGSRLDGDIFEIAICDICLNEKTLEGTVRYVDNYMYPGSEFIPLK
jgi:hypothetical protein